MQGYTQKDPKDVKLGDIVSVWEQDHVVVSLDHEDAKQPFRVVELEGFGPAWPTFSAGEKVWVKDREGDYPKADLKDIKQGDTILVVKDGVHMTFKVHEVDNLYAVFETLDHFTFHEKVRIKLGDLETPNLYLVSRAERKVPLFELTPGNKVKNKQGGYSIFQQFKGSKVVFEGGEVGFKDLGEYLDEDSNFTVLN